MIVWVTGNCRERSYMEGSRASLAREAYLFLGHFCLMVNVELGLTETSRNGVVGDSSGVISGKQKLFV